MKQIKVREKDPILANDQITPCVSDKESILILSQDKEAKLTAGTTSVAQDSSSHNSRKPSSSGDPPDSNNENESASDFSDESPKRHALGQIRTKQQSNEQNSPYLNHDDTFLIPPPEDLIARSVFTTEPIRTGGPFSFVKLDSLRGGENTTELTGQALDKKALQENESGKSSQKSLAEELVKHHQEGNLVYCRFGKAYVANLEKQLNSLLQNNTTTISTSLRSATFLINVKKLIKEHNIESEHNFSKLKTKNNVSKNSEGPPQQYYQLENEQDQTLLFESRFESGNLLSAIKLSDNEYDLILQNDINTNGHTQWYFFRVSNTKKNQKIKFNILNLAKPDSLYNYGMKILSYSQNLRKEQNVGWHRVGYYYTFTFTHEFESTNDLVYFAHCFPYTYSDLADDLSRIEKDTYTQNFFHRNTLCRTLAGNKCEYLTITSKDKDPKSEQSLQKKGVFISSRVHPGESNASWMMKGLIDFLVSNAPEARVLREKFVFKIVPMINPDGVINGNYRCALCGSDLNRRYKAPSKVLHPVVFSIKRLVKAFQKEREFALFCDFHGHSRRKNIFMYGNSIPEKPEDTRMFPFILSKLCDYFSFEQSRFSMHKSKEATARISLWKELKIPAIYTMEASFCGADKGELKDKHFTTDNLMLSGRRVLEALLVYCKIDVQVSLNEIRHKGRKKGLIEEEKLELPSIKLNLDMLQKELKENKELIKMTEGKEEGDGDSSASDSDPSEDNLEEEEMAKIIPIKLKKKKQEVKKKPEKPLVKKKIEEPIVISPTKKDQKNAKPVNRSPVKRILLKLRQLKKIEMVDAWTQTSDRGSDNEEAKKNQRVASATGLKSKHTMPLQQSSFVQDDIKADLTDIMAEDEALLKQKHSDQNILQMNQTQKIMMDSGQSPQPQIRIRKEPFKPQIMPANLAKYEERLLLTKNQPDAPKTQVIDPDSRNLNGNITPVQNNLQSANATIIKSNQFDNDSASHLRHFSIENPHSVAQYQLANNALSSRGGKHIISQQQQLVTLSNQKDLNNVTSPKSSNWRAASMKINQLKSEQIKDLQNQQIQRFRGSSGATAADLKTNIPATYQQRQNIYSSLEKQQSQIISGGGGLRIAGAGGLPDLNDPYANIQRINQKQAQGLADTQILNHQLSGNFLNGNRGSQNNVGMLLMQQQQQQQKYNLNQSAQNIAIRSHQHQQFRIYNGFSNETSQLQVSNGQIKASENRSSSFQNNNNASNNNQNKQLSSNKEGASFFFCNSDYQQKTFQQQIQLQNVKMRQAFDNISGHGHGHAKSPEKQQYL